MRPRKGDDLAVTLSRDELRQLILDTMIEAGRAASNDGFHSLDYEQVADRLGVCTATVRRWVRKEGLPAVHLGGNLYRVLETDLLEWLCTRRTGGRKLRAVK